MKKNRWANIRLTYVGERSSLGLSLSGGGECGANKTTNTDRGQKDGEGNFFPLPDCVYLGLLLAWQQCFPTFYSFI